MGVIVFIRVHGQRRHFLGCKLLGVEANKSNISDQHDEIYSKRAASDNSEAWKVKSLWVYPVKSCSGIELQHVKFIKTGMAYDSGTTSQDPGQIKSFKSKGPMEVYNPAWTAADGETENRNLDTG